MSEFSIDTEKLNVPIKNFGEASSKLKDCSRQISEVGNSLNGSFTDVIPVVEALARRTNDQSMDVQVLGLTLNSAAKEYMKFEQLIVNNSKNGKTTLTPPRAVPTRTNPGTGGTPTDPTKNVSPEDLAKLKERYGFTDEEFDWLQKNCPSLLLSLYATDKYSSADAKKVLEQIREKLANRNNPTPSSEPGTSCSDAGVDFIKSNESFVDHPYNNGQTIGYGTDIANYPDGYINYNADGTISEAEAERILRETIKGHEETLNKYLEDNGLSLSQSQYDACIDLMYNRGGKNQMVKDVISAMASGDDAKVKSLLDNFDYEYAKRYLYDGDEAKARAYVERNSGLATRRQKEYEMYLNK